MTCVHRYPADKQLSLYIGVQVPEVMTSVNWLHSFQLNSRLQRAKYYKYLRLLELSKQNQLIKRKEKQKLMQAELSSLPSDPVEKQAKSTIFLRIYESTINKVGRMSWHAVACDINICLMSGFLLSSH